KEGRRREAQDILRSLKEPLNTLPKGEKTEQMLLAARSLYAESLAVLDLGFLTEQDQVTLPHWGFHDWPAALHPEGAAMVIGLPSGPVYWARGARPNLPAKIDIEGKVPPRLWYSPDGTYLAFAPAEGGLQVWDREVTRKLYEAPAKDKAAVLAV